MHAQILSLHTPSAPWMKSQVKTFFSESSRVAYQIPVNGLKSIMQTHITLSLHTSSTPRMGSKCQNIFFTESSHVAYQIKENGIKSTMQARILSLQTPSTSRWGQKVNTFFLLKIVILHIILKGKKNRLHVT